MTFAKFLKEVKALKLQWKEEPTGIRCHSGDCPILALAKAKGLVAKEGFINSTYEDAGKKLGISSSLAHRIASAADLHGRSKPLKTKKKIVDMHRQMEKALLHQR